MSAYSIVPEDLASFSSLHLCEAPGGFIIALNHFLSLNKSHIEVSVSINLPILCNEGHSIEWSNIVMEK